MLRKPFRPPLLEKAKNLRNGADRQAEQTPSAKKRKISRSPEREHAVPFDASATRTESDKTSITASREYEVLWRKFTMKKHKTWDGDGVLIVADGYARLQDDANKVLGRTHCNVPLLPGSTLSVAGLEVEIQSLLSVKNPAQLRISSEAKRTAAVRELNADLQTNVRFNANPTFKAIEPNLDKSIRVAAPKSNSASTHFKSPLIDTTTLRKGRDEKPTPRHDPTLPGALVMARLPSHPPGTKVVDVVVDPILSKHLRNHQREGVKFMYECIMGMQPHNGEGAILADEMGLGKTLQVIALLWTLLKQSPIYEDPPLIKKALIVCPVGLIKNWRKEFRKWLGLERIGIFILDGNRTKVTDFTHGRSYSVMIIGYEKLRAIHTDLQKGAGVDIVIADEGHRLKTAQNKSAQAIKALNTEKRIILSGTPLQNDLSELFFMVDFVNPGLLGRASIFKRDFENPILKSRQPRANSRDIEKGQARSDELAELTKTCILRRTADILSGYLPPKSEFVLFCRPTRTQASIYRSFLASSLVNEVLISPETSLQMINVLKKLCNSPSLLKVREHDEEAETFLDSVIADLSPNHINTPGASCKLQVLDSLLHTIRTTTDEKVIIVSHYTSTLDMLQNLLSSLSYTWLRLDGSTAAGKRQGLVDNFNRVDATTCFAFLLSAKSGGTGLNLIGASRLILFDIDWNPSTDLQAMARIHRDGQKRPCRIYRLLTRGALDEKIYQRQLNKLSLADSVIDNKSSASSFSREELRQLFTLDESSRCQTHDLLGCRCPGLGLPLIHRPAADKNIVSGIDELEAIELSEVGGLQKASEVDMERQERDIRGRDNPATLANSSKTMLMEYHHFDTIEITNGIDDEEDEALIDDSVLASVLKERENQISFVFARLGR